MNASMPYRRLGTSGLRLSALSLGSWVTYHNQVDVAAAREMLAAAFDAGINFFDNAEAYANGRSETIMGEALRSLKRARLDYCVSTKFFWGLDRARPGQPPRANAQDTLNRKYLMQAIDGSLQRFGLGHIDLVFCHRSDPATPIEETVRAMHDMIAAGKVLHWGTSEWSAGDIRAAWEIAERHHLHKPVMEQPQYNLFHRSKVEDEYARLYDDIGLGLTTWSPLASGLLTGKYRSGAIPEGSRGAMGCSMRRRTPRSSARRHRTRTRRLGGATCAGLGGAQPARQHGDSRRVEARSVEGEPRRARAVAEVVGRGAEADRRDHEAAGCLSADLPDALVAAETIAEIEPRQAASDARLMSQEFNRILEDFLAGVRQ